VTARQVEGRVVDPAGAPVAGARVTIVESPAPMPEMAILTGADGRFALNLPPGQFTLRADGDEGDWGMATFDSEAGVEIVLKVARHPS
jgi:hypothetical protein